MHDTCLHWEYDACLNFQPRKPSSRFELFQRELRKFNIKTSNKLKGGCSKGRISLRPHTKRHCEGHHLVRQYQLIAALAHFQRSMPIMGQGRSELVLTELRALRYDPPPSPSQGGRLACAFRKFAQRGHITHPSPIPYGLLGTWRCVDHPQ